MHLMTKSLSRDSLTEDSVMDPDPVWSETHWPDQIWNTLFGGYDRFDIKICITFAKSNLKVVIVVVQ